MEKITSVHRTEAALPAIFVRKGLALWAGGILLLSLGAMGLGVYIVATRSFWGGAGVIVVSFLLFAVLGLIALLGWSDIVIEADRISRRLFGRTWQTMRWDNVERVVEFSVPDMKGHRLRAFFIYPKVKAAHTFMPSGRMNFADDMQDFEGALVVLNRFIAKYNIKVEKQVNGATQSALQL